jgi:hypothetical protein
MNTTREQSLLADPAVSYWLKGQIRQTRDRDVLDALRDAELLSEVLRTRAEECLRAASGGCSGNDVPAPVHPPDNPP